MDTDKTNMCRTIEGKEAVEQYLFSRGWKYDEGYIDPKDGKNHNFLGFCYFIETVREDLEKYNGEVAGVTIFSDDLTSNNITVKDKLTGKTLI